MSQMTMDFQTPMYLDYNIYKNILNDIKHKGDKVGFILEHFPETRNNDRLLCVLFWKLIDECEVIDDLIYATKPEVIRRSRQKWQEKGKYLPTDPSVTKRRKLLAEEMRQGINSI